MKDTSIKIKTDDGQVLTIFAKNGEDGKTPTKEELISIIEPLIPAPLKGEDGKTPPDEKIIQLIQENTPEEPINYDKIVEEVLGKIPPSEQIDYEILKKFCFDEIRKLEEARPVRQLQSAGPTTSFGDISDVEVSGIQTGQSVIFNGQVFIPYTPAEASNMSFSETPSGSGTAFTLAHTPINNSLRLYRGGARQMPVEDYTITGDEITLLIALATGEILLADYEY